MQTQQYAICREKPLPLSRRTLSCNASKKPDDNPDISDFLRCHNHLLTEWPALVKQQPHFPTGEKQEFWLFQARRATSLVSQRHWSCEKSLNNSSLWRSVRPNSSAKQGCAEHCSLGEPLNMDRLQPGSRQDQRESILVMSCY